jgi:hypothetical protein
VLLLAAALLIAGLLVASCSGGSGHAASTTSATTGREPPKATIPGAVDPGKGWLSLEEDSVELRVTSCAGADPAPADPTAQRRYELVGRGTVDGDEVEVKATDFKSDTGDATTLTQTVTVSSKHGKATVGLVAKRSFFGGHWLDLNDRSATKPLFERRGQTLVVAAKFGPQGSQEGDPGVIDGAMIAACPAA